MDPLPARLKELRATGYRSSLRLLIVNTQVRPECWGLLSELVEFVIIHPKTPDGSLPVKAACTFSTELYQGLAEGRDIVESFLLADQGYHSLFRRGSGQLTRTTKQGHNVFVWVPIQPSGTSVEEPVG